MIALRCLALVLIWILADSTSAAEVKLFRQNQGPYQVPRPAPGQKHVPLTTSLYFELGMFDGPGDVVLPDSVSVELQPDGGVALSLMRSGRSTAPDYTVKVIPATAGFFAGPKDGGQKVLVSIDSEAQLLPETTYTVKVAAESREGLSLSSEAGTWQFTTEAATTKHKLEFSTSLKNRGIDWKGGFFTGIVVPSFSTSHKYRIPTFEILSELHKTSPKAWSNHRDFWMTGMNHQTGAFLPTLPNIVRERETRRITRVDAGEESVLLHAEDFFGHEQYGIPPNRPLSADYHAGDEVLIADGVHDARAFVLSVDDRARSIRVKRFNEPAEGWRLEYTGPLPVKEDPVAPGLFPPGGTYLRKFSPRGTPCYFWGRLDHEWDLVHRKFGQRICVNFADAPGDLSIDGRNWTTAKDYIELHEAVHAITSHIIERYGDKALTFSWSVFNEPDLGPAFWRASWDELQKFYDYTVDGVLRAFEDRGYDSNRVFIGGLELAASRGPLKLDAFLAHCSPRAEAKGAVLSNAAYADKRLDGKRSRRVENLCRKNIGRGSPCDFISIHSYGMAQSIASKLARAKEIALAIDPEYYASLWINSHEACPDWTLPTDPAYSDSFLGNGFFESWCADVVRRQLQQAAEDSRYAFGESILTFWPWQAANFAGGPDCVRELHIDDTGDGKADRSVTVASPVLHLLGLVAEMEKNLHVLPEQTVGGHVVSGFVSAADGEMRLLLYSHHEGDTKSGARSEFDVTVNLQDLTQWKGKRVTIQEHRFDVDHNSYCRLGRELRDSPDAARDASNPETMAEIQTALSGLASGKADVQIAAMNKLAELGPRAASTFHTVMLVSNSTDNAALRAAGDKAFARITEPKAFPAATIAQIQEASLLRATSVNTSAVNPDGALRINARLAANGVNVLIIKSDEP